MHRAGEAVQAGTQEQVSVACKFISDACCHVYLTVQRIHRMEVGITRGAEGRTGKAFVASMTEEKAMELASKVVSEGFLYGVRFGAGHAGLGVTEGAGEYAEAVWELVDCGAAGSGLPS